MASSPTVPTTRTVVPSTTTPAAKDRFHGAGSSSCRSTWPAADPLHRIAWLRVPLPDRVAQPTWSSRAHAKAHASRQPRGVRSTNDAALPVHSAARATWSASALFFQPTTPTCCPSPTPCARETCTSGG